MSEKPENMAPPQAAGSAEPPGGAQLGYEVFAVYGVALALVLAIVLVGQQVSLVGANTYVLVAAVFVGLPYWLLGRLKLDFDAFGLTWQRWQRGVLWGLVFSALTAIPFAFGYGWWETKFLGREYAFSWDNYAQWPLETQGRPKSWASRKMPNTLPGEREAGVWVWADGPELFVGVAAGDEPVEVRLGAKNSAEAGAKSWAEPTLTGDAKLLKTDDESGALIARVEGAGERAQLRFSRAERAPPRELFLGAARVGSAREVPIFLGPDAAPAAVSAAGELELKRGIYWIALWLLTQVVFIALPEEFFYRGYIQTRLRQYFQARRREKGEPQERSTWLRLTPENWLTSLLFALGHLFIPIGGVLMLNRASVFFPSLLFGWLRERTGSIVAPVTYHAAANMMVLLAAPHFF